MSVVSLQHMGAGVEAVDDMSPLLIRQWTIKHTSVRISHQDRLGHQYDTMLHQMSHSWRRSVKEPRYPSRYPSPICHPVYSYVYIDEDRMIIKILQVSRSVFRWVQVSRSVSPTLASSLLLIAVCGLLSAPTER